MIIQSPPEPKKSFTALTASAMSLTFPHRSGWMQTSRISRNFPRFALIRTILLSFWILIILNSRLLKKIKIFSQYSHTHPKNKDKQMHSGRILSHFRPLYFYDKNSFTTSLTISVSSLLSR